jgi:hypothetical protein
MRVDPILKRTYLHMRAEHCQTKLTPLLFILCMVTAYPHVLKAEPPGSRVRAIHLQGRVIDGSTGKSLEKAHIRILPSGKGGWSTDTQGRFTFWIPESIGERVEISKENYQLVCIDARPRSLGNIRLEPVPSSVRSSSPSNKLVPASQSVAPAIITAESAKKVSGTGDAWSPWYRLGVGRAPGGYTVQESEFWLSGDRACGAWAECRELVKNDSEVLWEFRLQGHSELEAPQKAFSSGHIRVIYRPQ